MYKRGSCCAVTQFPLWLSLAPSRNPFVPREPAALCLSRWIRLPLRIRLPLPPQVAHSLGFCFISSWQRFELLHLGPKLEQPQLSTKDGELEPRWYQGKGSLGVSKMIKKTWLPGLMSASTRRSHESSSWSPFCLLMDKCIPDS